MCFFFQENIFISVVDSPHHDWQRELGGEDMTKLGFDSEEIGQMACTDGYNYVLVIRKRQWFVPRVITDEFREKRRQQCEKKARGKCHFYNHYDVCMDSFVDCCFRAATKQ